MQWLPSSILWRGSRRLLRLCVLEHCCQQGHVFIVFRCHCGGLLPARSVRHFGGARVYCHGFRCCGRRRSRRRRRGRGCALLQCRVHDRGGLLRGRLLRKSGRLRRDRLCCMRGQSRRVPGYGCLFLQPNPGCGAGSKQRGDSRKPCAPRCIPPNPLAGRNRNAAAICKSCQYAMAIVPQRGACKQVRPHKSSQSLISLDPSDCGPA